MDIKYNIATTNRPDGSRLLDAPWVYAELDTIIEQLRDESAWEKNDRNGITIFKTDRFTLVVTILKAGASIMKNSIDEFLTLHVLEGKAEIQTEDCPVIMSKGNLLHLHPFVNHNIIAQEETIFLLSTYKC
jgi:quercetin dioxygenase-like cupin family protein